MKEFYIERNEGIKLNTEASILLKTVAQQQNNKEQQKKIYQCVLEKCEAALKLDISGEGYQNYLMCSREDMDGILKKPEDWFNEVIRLTILQPQYNVLVVELMEKKVTALIGLGDLSKDLAKKVKLYNDALSECNKALSLKTTNEGDEIKTILRDKMNSTSLKLDEMKGKDDNKEG